MLDGRTDAENAGTALPPAAVVPEPPDPTALADATAPPAPRPHVRRWILIAILAAVAIGIGVAVVRRQHRPEGPRFETQAVTRGPLQARVTANGTLSALVTVQV